MNDMVKYMVELLFQNVEENAEVTALREELLVNCQEHYEDLIRRGVSEADAIDAVAESLQGMEEVIAQYPGKKQDAPAEKVTYATPVENAQQQVTDIRLTMRTWDVQLVPAVDGKLDICCEGQNADLIETRIEGETLQVIEHRPEGASGAQAKMKMKEMKWSSFDEMMDSIRSTIKIAADLVSSNIGIAHCGQVVIKLPSAVRSVRHSSASGNLLVSDVRTDTLESGTSSGDVSVRTTAPMHSAVLSSSSGDIVLTADADRVTGRSSSGDLTYEGAVHVLNLHSVSGDICIRGKDVPVEEVTLHSVSGDVELDTSCGGLLKATVDTVSGDVKALLPQETGAVRLDIKTTSGDKYINIPEDRDARVRLSIKTVSGDVMVM